MQRINRAIHSSVFSLATLLLLVHAGVATAQVQRTGGGAANAQLAAQYQQVVTERAQLQADNEKLKKQLDDLKKELETAKRQLAVSSANAGTAATQLAAAQAASQSATQSLDQTKARMQELITRFRETAVALKGVESDRSQLQQESTQTKADLSRCVERNAQLYQVDTEVLDRYEHQSAFSYMARGEPFTRLKRTQVENFAEEYRERAQELKMRRDDQAGAAPAQAAQAQQPAPVPFKATPAESTDGAAPTSK
jgi:chromosome segregation ATPase